MSTPLYLTITRAIKEQIDCGALAPGSRIPSVSELRSQYGVSHITARRVYRELLAMNCICGKRGTGYMVAQGRDGGNIFFGRIGNFLRPLRPVNPNDNYFNTINFASYSSSP
jgi:DNA-binding GntR family transcriptional regulator